jgi:NAD(P)H-hydrate repair Nnr-like enzyme with NAD(P)H-hydrate epimerase domain
MLQCVIHALFGAAFRRPPKAAPASLMARIFAQAGWQTLRYG